jgi:PAS domain S-box-containing protein
MANSIVSFTPEPELFELLEDLIIVHNLEGRIRYINRYVQKLLGYSPYDVLNKSILNFLPNRYKEKYLHYLQSIKREFRPGYHAFAPASPLVSILAAKKGKGG